MGLKFNNGDLLEILTLSGFFAESFFEEHAEYTNEQLVQMYGRPKITFIYLCLEADRNGVHLRLFMFNKIMEAIDNKGPEDLLELREYALPIAIEEFRQYRNLQPMSEMIERKMPEALGNEYVIKVITAKLRDDMSEFFPETRGKRTSQKRHTKARDDVIIALIHYYKGLGIPIWSSPESLSRNPHACGIISQKLEEMGFEIIDPESIYKHIWRKKKNEHEGLNKLIYDAGHQDKR